MDEIASAIQRIIRASRDLPKDASARDRTRIPFARFLEGVRDNRDLFLILRREGFAADPEFIGYVDSIFSDFSRDLASELEEYVRAGVVPSINTDLVARAIIGMCYSLWTYYLEAEEDQFETILDTLTGMALGGIIYLGGRLPGSKPEPEST